MTQHKETHILQVFNGYCEDILDRVVSLGQQRLDVLVQVEAVHHHLHGGWHLLWQPVMELKFVDFGFQFLTMMRLFYPNCCQVLRGPEILLILKLTDSIIVL